MFKGLNPLFSWYPLLTLGTICDLFVGPRLQSLLKTNLNNVYYGKINFNDNFYETLTRNKIYVVKKVINPFSVTIKSNTIIVLV